ncbi:MAG: sensor domain-containing diguanylate cyclase [Desulfobacteraceae bacterium]|nr:sensor domain-containing diguanylate cyclase [Desulfobacteraceae bacterium]
MIHEIVENPNDFSFFIELGKPLSKAKSIKETFDVIMYQIGDIFQPENWSLLLNDSKTDEMIFTIVVGNNKQDLQGMRIPKGKGIVGHIVSTGKSLIVGDVEHDRRFDVNIDKQTGFKTQSIIGVPLITGKKIFGVIELINKISGENFTAMDLKVLSSIAEYAAIAIERSYYNQALQKIAWVDLLTGVNNRNGFERAINTRMETLKRYKTPFSILMLDIDGFKLISNKYGHSIGDEILKKMASVLKKTVRKTDKIFRYEGDEFIILMPTIDKQKAGQAKQRLLTQFKDFDKQFEDDIKCHVRILDYTLDTYDLAKLSSILDKKLLNQTIVEYEDNIENLGENIQPLLEQEAKEAQNIQAEKKKKYGKKVSLQGEFTFFKIHGHGSITVTELSMQRIGFQASDRHEIRPEDILDVKFTLKDKGRSVIKRRVIVDLVKDGFVQGEFYNPPPYDKDLGFYIFG